MQARNSHLPLLIAIVLVAFATFSAWYIYMYLGVSNAMRSYDPTPSKTCREEYTEGMTAEEVSALMRIPLIRFNWLPNDIEDTTPRIEPHGLLHTDDSGDVTCVIRLSYPEFYSDVLAPQDKQNAAKITCNEYEDISGSSTCWGEIKTPEGISAISMFAHYPVDVAQRIADSVELSVKE